MSRVIIGKDIEVKIHGYEHVPEIITPSPKIIEACNEIADAWQPLEDTSIYPKTKKEVKNGAKKFLCPKLKLHRVFYKNYLAGLDYHILKNINNMDICLKINGLTGAYISPFLLPVHFCASSSTGGMVIENVTYLRLDYYLERVKVSFKEIQLSPVISELTESSYVHELIHTQLLDRRGSIKDYYNGEVLSIFFELLNIYETESKRLIKINDSIRLTELFNDINTLDFARTGDIEASSDDLINNGTYATSIAKAYSLLIEYVNGTPALKKYILNSIQNIIDGNLELEELLDEFEITFDSCFENQKLLKHVCH